MGLRSLLISIVILVKVADLSASCTKGSIGFVRTTNVSPPARLLKDIRPLFLTSSACHHLCTRQENCSGYLIDVRNNSCLLVTSLYAVMIRQSDFESNQGWNYHRKLCLPPNAVCSRDWIFQEIPSTQLLALDKKTIQDVLSSDHCIEACALEKSFICRSARYDMIKRTCSLSRHDRRTSPESFKRAAHQLIYLENQCVRDPSKCNFIKQNPFKLMEAHAYETRKAESKADCENYCSANPDFNCRSFSFDTRSRTCSMSPDDSASFGESAIKALLGRTTKAIQEVVLSETSSAVEFYEKGSCIDVEIQCDANTMTALITTAGPFRGRIFTQTHPQECYNIADKDETNLIALSIPLHGRQCGTINMGNGTFSNSLLVQHHPLVLRETDRRIEVACDYYQIRRKLRGGKQVSEGEPITMTQVITGLVPTPPVSLRVVNASGEEVEGVELGDPLYLKVEMLDQSVFGIFGSELVARSGEGSESVVLIDDHGCPVEPGVFPALEREQKDSKSLIAPFQAFRFASDSSVKFQMTVSFCLDSCQPVACGAVTSETKPGKPVDSFGRRRRRRRRKRAAAAAAATAATGSVELSSEKFFGSSNNSDPLPSIDELQSGDILTDVTMETTLFVVNNLKPLGTPNDENKLMKKHRLKKQKIVPSEPNSSATFGVHMAKNGGVCFSPFIVYTTAIIGVLSQLSIFTLCFWMFFLTPKEEQRRHCSSSQFDASSTASVSSKTGLYDS